MEPKNYIHIKVLRMLHHVLTLGLKTFVSGICEQSYLRFDDEFGGNIWVLFSGDKGGDSLKFHLEILNNRNVGSVDNVHCFCFYKATCI